MPVRKGLLSVQSTPGRADRTRPESNFLHYSGFRKTECCGTRTYVHKVAVFTRKVVNMG